MMPPDLPILICYPSKLLHFTRRRQPIQEPVRLGTATITPSEGLKMLGVWLDWKLNWSIYLEKLKKKILCQQCALSAITALI
ncbi:hypothetical protein BKA56DRAFT_694363 [Ilyonectria sp. MPI-CAGE-AT-0026]|nr:hypothetical protein BKA56DRAFT_694363 [Ilyonectria sp. MPI-CAGE-AT-0026]